MAQKPVPNALTLELTDVVAENIDRHRDTAELWYAHEHVPYDEGENFAFLGGRDWEPSDVKLPRAVVDAVQILLITKDNLAGYHREMVEHFSLEIIPWADFIGRWTAEENLHAIALREYLVVTRNADPNADEDTRLAHVMKGYRADSFSQIETLVFNAFFEQMHAVFVQNLAAQTEDAVLKGLLANIEKDERRHEQMYSNIVLECLRLHPEDTIAAIKARAAELKVIGADIDGYEDKVATVAEAGIIDGTTVQDVVRELTDKWGVTDRL